MLNIRSQMRASTLIIIGASLSCFGCGASIQEYAKFADAGQSYYTALDKLLAASGDTILDTHSEILLRDQKTDELAIQQVRQGRNSQDFLELIKILENKKEALRNCEKDVEDGVLNRGESSSTGAINQPTANPVPLSPTQPEIFQPQLETSLNKASVGLRRAEYECFTKLDETWLTTLSDIRTHNKLLRKYFNGLRNLATSDAPNDAKASVQDIFTQINNIGNGLRGSPIFVESKVPDAASQIAGLIIRAKIKQALRDELESRKDAISKELNTQTLLLEFLGTKLSGDLRIIRNSQDRRYVLTPFVNNQVVGRSSEDGWIDDRRNIRLFQLQIAALGEAKNTSSDLEEAFKELLSDQLSIARANALLDGISDLLEIAETLRR